MDVKQLQYFMICAETGSFTAAADRLYTTQPNVSKTIKALEAEIGAALFRREKYGIELTEKGKYVYEHAGKVMDEIDLLKDFSDTKTASWLRMSCIPSSRLSQLFVDFYDLHKEEDMHYRVFSTGVNNVLERLKDGKDDIGFIFLEESRRQAIEYTMMRHRLQFVPLKTAKYILFLGEGTDEKEQLEKLKKKEKLRLVQSYYDEITKENDRILNGKDGNEFGELDPVVVTNSDYIMERILKTTDLANISAGSILSEEDNKNLMGNAIELEGHEVSFGFVCRKSETLTPAALEFVRYIKSRI